MPCFPHAATSTRQGGSVFPWPAGDSIGCSLASLPLPAGHIRHERGIAPLHCPLTPCVTLPHHDNMAISARKPWSRPFSEKWRFRAVLSAKSFSQEQPAGGGRNSGIFSGNSHTKIPAGSAFRHILAPSRKASRCSLICSWGNHALSCRGGNVGPGEWRRTRLRNLAVPVGRECALALNPCPICGKPEIPLLRFINEQITIDALLQL